MVTPVYILPFNSYHIDLVDSSDFKPKASSDFKPKRSSRDKKPLQGRVTPLVGDHKVDHGYVPKTSTSTFTSPTKLWQNSDIKFYNQHERYYEFTNFSSYPIKLDGKEWPTTEHYFQAQKFIGTPYAEAIRKQRYPRGAFDMSRNPNVSRWRRGDWDQVKDDVMLKCLRAKFTQHKDLKKMLLDTGERNLIEHTFNDSYWGDGGDGSGQNKLGKLLMQVRKELSKQTHEHKAAIKSSLDYSFNREKSHDKKKHRRRNSISGITVTAPAVHGTQPTLTSSKKFKSTENLHQFLAEKSTQSSSKTFEMVKRQCGESLTSYSHTQLRPTIVRSSSLGDLYRRSSSNHLNSLAVHGRNARDYHLRDTTKKYRLNDSSVPYNIINNK